MFRNVAFEIHRESHGDFLSTRKHVLVLERKKTASKELQPLKWSRRADPCNMGVGVWLVPARPGERVGKLADGVNSEFLRTRLHRLARAAPANNLCFLSALLTDLSLSLYSLRGKVLATGTSPTAHKETESQRMAAGSVVASPGPGRAEPAHQSRGSGPGLRDARGAVMSRAPRCPGTRPGGPLVPQEAGRGRNPGASWLPPPRLGPCGPVPGRVLTLAGRGRRCDLGAAHRRPVRGAARGTVVDPQQPGGSGTCVTLLGAARGEGLRPRDRQTSFSFFCRLGWWGFHPLFFFFF